MEKRVLADYVKRNKPLVEITIEPANGVDPEWLACQLNQLGEDLDVYPHWGVGVDPNCKLLAGQTTPEALSRYFGWTVVRTELQSGVRYWNEVSGPTTYPTGLATHIASLGMSQPGQCDNGQPYP